MKIQHRSVKYSVAASILALSLQARGNSGGPAPVQIATGQYVTPNAAPGFVQQFLNPGLSKYPSFIAGEAVKSQLSPDGTTLAILCAGQNSLYASDGTVDVANSTQYIFLYDVSGAHRAVRCSWSTWRISPASWQQARTRHRSRTPTS
jgi:hypothetical protein